MKFIDEARIYVKAGDGGHGCASFRREKFVPKGGPDGGDGGKGGDVAITATADLASLLDFRYRHSFKAENGKSGSGSNKRGRDGKNVPIRVPLGTLVFDENESTLLCDITGDGETRVIARGGKGGRGNARFVSSTHQAPVEFEFGEPGEERHLKLVLKLLADVGLVGLPNVGKSTLISRLTQAKPKVGDYPFTTLTPTLGVLYRGDETIVIADIPGIVEGASQGKGLGLTFLRHIERSRMIVLLLDASSPTLAEDYEILKNELTSFKEDMWNKGRIVALNKVDKLSETETETRLTYLREKGEKVIAISALKKRGIAELTNLIREERGHTRQAHA